MEKWRERSRPVCLEKRFEFQTYEDLRGFLERLGQHSEKFNRYPDISFGKTYANITLRPESEEENSQLTDKDHNFALQIDSLFG